jgi:hypothetical protein
MKLQRTALAASMIALVTAGWCAAELHRLQARLERISSNPRPPEAPGAGPGPQPANVEQRLKKLEVAMPGVGDVMSGIQLHFAKLYFAGEARNWDLARFERGEIEEGLNAVAALRPEEKGVDFVGLIDAFKQTQLTSLKDGVEMKDRGLFREAYQDTVVMCNACHQSTGRPFITITIPTNPPVANQRWEPPAEGGK